MGFVVSWISAHSGEHNVHTGKIETLLRLYIAYTYFILVPALTYSRYRATTECKTIARYVSAEHETKSRFDFTWLPVSLKSACRSLQSPKNLLGLRKAFEPVGHYYLCHVDGIHATKEYNAGSVKHDTRKIKYCIKKIFCTCDIQMDMILVQKVMVML